MKPIELSHDARPHHGHNAVFINPEEVAAIYRNVDSVDNPTIVSLKNGKNFAVEGWPDAVAKKLFPESVKLAPIFP